MDRILIIRTDKLGDMVLTLPMAKAIKDKYPAVHLTMLAAHYTQPLLKGQPLIDDIIFIDDCADNLKDKLSEGKFDAAFFPRPRFDEAFAAFRAGIPARIGSGYRWYSLLFNHRVYEHRKTAERHEAEYNVRLIDSFFGTKSSVSLVPPVIAQEKINEISDLLESKSLDLSHESVIIHPGSGGSSRDLNAENFGRIAQIFSEKLKWNVFITGSGAEEEKCRFIASMANAAVNLCNEIDLEAMIALISFSRVMVSNSTGILHIAAALGKEVIGFYPNSPHLSSRRWGPYTEKRMIFSPPINKDSQISDDMSFIDMKQVEKEILVKYGN